MTSTWTRWLWLGLLFGLAACVARPPQPTPPAAPTATPTATAGAIAVTLFPTPTPTLTPPGPTANPQATATPLTWERFQEGVALLAVQQGLTVRLYAFQPRGLTWTVLLERPLQALAVHAASGTLAVTLHHGTWRLARMDLAGGPIQPFSPNAAYEGQPSWSPDGRWLVYTAYDGENADLWIRSADDENQAPIRLTRHPAVDAEPNWSAQGRIIAFRSLRTGLSQIYLINLDRPNEVLQVSQGERGEARRPAWSPDGRYLVWSQTEQGLARLWLWDALDPQAPPRAFGEGAWPAWSPDGRWLWAVVSRPEGDYLTAYGMPEGAPVLPLLPVPGRVLGVAIAAGLPPRPAAGLPPPTPTPVWTPGPADAELVEVPDVPVEYPYLVRPAAEAFQTLRQAVQERLGWDALGQVQSLYMPPTQGQVLPEGVNWMATGRAFALPSQWLEEDRMAVVQEPYFQAVYWRVYLKPTAQDGSQGQPLLEPVWDFALGEPTAPPPGFWLDFTALAQAYGWYRLPALPYWQTYFPGSRFNLFVFGPP